MARVHILALLVPAPFLASSLPRYNSPKQDQNFPDFGQYYHMNIVPEEDAVPDWINPWRFHSPRAVGVTSPALDRVAGVYDGNQDNEEKIEYPDVNPLMQKRGFMNIVGLMKRDNTMQEKRNFVPMMG